MYLVMGDVLAYTIIMYLDMVDILGHERFT